MLPVNLQTFLHGSFRPLTLDDPIHELVDLLVLLIVPGSKANLDVGTLLKDALPLGFSVDLFLNAEFLLCFDVVDIQVFDPLD